jgi:hypothetical protein
MSGSRAGANVKETVRPPENTKTNKDGRVEPAGVSPRKPTGPVVYTIEKGANVWPWLK